MRVSIVYQRTRRELLRDTLKAGGALSESLGTFSLES